MGRYCSGCITLKVKESACVCRVLWDIDHLPLELHELRQQSAKVDDLMLRLNWVLKHLVGYRDCSGGGDIRRITRI